MTPHEILSAFHTLLALFAEVERLRGALVAERESNLWNAYHAGIERDGRWIDAGMSDAEWLVRECGLTLSKNYGAEEIKAAIPKAAQRVLENQTHD